MRLDDETRGRDRSSRRESGTLVIATMATSCVPRAVADGRAGRARYRRTGRFLEHRRLHSACGDVPPAEFEAAYYQRLQATVEAA